jgi:hypothetical protein
MLRPAKRSTAKSSGIEFVIFILLQHRARARRVVIYKWIDVRFGSLADIAQNRRHVG